MSEQSVQLISSEDTQEEVDIKESIGAYRTNAKARAFRSSSQTIGTGSSTKVEFNAVSYDPGGNFDITTNYRFNVPRSGIYMVAGSVSLNSITDQTELRLAFKVSGVSKSVGENHSSGGTGLFGISHSDILQLSMGDYVEMFIEHDDGGDRTLFGSPSLDYMAVHLLST